MEKMKEKREHPLYDPQSQLRAALRFTEEDLQANREGYMTKKQRSELGKNRRRWMFLLGIVIVFALLMTIGIIAGSIQKIAVFTSQIEVLALIWIISLAIALFFWLKKKDIDDDLNKGTVESVEGAIQTGENIVIQRGTPRYYMRLQDMSWHVTLVMFSTFHNGDWYVLYYLPNSERLLSAEWLGDTRWKK